MTSPRTCVCCAGIMPFRGAKRSGRSRSLFGPSSPRPFVLRGGDADERKRDLSRTFLVRKLGKPRLSWTAIWLVSRRSTGQSTRWPCVFRTIHTPQRHLRISGFFNKRRESPHSGEKNLPLLALRDGDFSFSNPEFHHLRWLGMVDAVRRSV